MFSARKVRENAGIYRASLICTSGTSPVDLVHLVCLVHLVDLVQPNTRDRPKKPDNGLLTLADFFQHSTGRISEGGRGRESSPPSLILPAEY